MHNFQVAVHSHGSEKENAAGPVGCHKEEQDASGSVSKDPVLAPGVVVCSKRHEEQHHWVSNSHVCKVDGVQLPALHTKGEHAKGQNVPREARNELHDEYRG